jgi:predicted glycosyltransferase involved in capsule biosynthesis
MWNTALIASDSDNLLILNDDIEILNSDIFDKTLNHILSDDYHGLTKMNSSFSHFIVNKLLMESVGYFDESLLGFGEEDGDITYRLLKVNINVGNINVNGLVNIVSDIRHDHVVAGIGKYSNFNRDFIYNHKYKADYSSKLKGMFDTPMTEMLDNERQYPYENFFRENKNML